MKVRTVDGDIVRWTESDPSELLVQMIIPGNAMERQPVAAGILQGSPGSPNVCGIHTSRLIKWVKQYIPPVEGKFVVMHYRRVVTERDVKQGVMILQ
jgi:hypothetical protein